MNESNERLSQMLGWIGFLTMIMVWLPFCIRYIATWEQACSEVIATCAQLSLIVGWWLELVFFNESFVIYLAIPIICFVENLMLVDTPRFFPWRRLGIDEASASQDSD